MKDKVFKIITISVVVVIAACCLFPFLHVLAVSFSDKTAVIRGEVLLWPQSFKLSAYKAVFNNKGLMDSMWFTLILTVVYTVFSLIMTILCAYPLSYPGLKLKSPILLYILFTMYFSGGLIPTYLVVSKMHLLNTPWAMMIPGAVSIYNVIITRTYFVNSIPSSLQEAAELDGASKLQRIRYIDLPSIMPTVIIMLIMSAGNLMSIGFEKAYALQTDMNLPASEILSTYVYRIGLLNGDYGYSTAVGLFNSVINVILLIIVNAVVKKLNDGEGI